MMHALLSRPRIRSLLMLLPFAALALLIPFLGQEYSDNIGFLAACSTTLAFVPQVWQTLKTRDTQGISLGMYCLFVFGVFCWLNYGWMNNDMPVVVANALTLLLASMILILKILERPPVKAPRKPAEPEAE